MSRPAVTKKEDIIAAALAMFRKKGVNNTTVSDIAKEAHVAQGTFYNYFRSKDDIFAEVLEKATEHTLEETQKTVQKEDIGPVEKLKLLVQQDFMMNRRNDSLFDVLHEPRYAYAHQKYIVNRILKLKPICAGLIRQSVDAGYFDTPYPEETALLLLTTQKFVFDPAFFHLDGTEILKMIAPFGNFVERVLGAKHDPTMEKDWKQNILQYFGDGIK
ncbi:MAG: TetR/AcrR family transcriptional regulator [Spirochaetia bacterium]|jgi:AcrR family transcriptional regulator|nr:TetR/AcrR family transcriptional regulator [Spirochaetia bacterium]